MSFPDYGASVEQVAAWIEETAGLERGRAYKE